LIRGHDSYLPSGVSKKRSCQSHRFWLVLLLLLCDNILLRNGDGRSFCELLMNHLHYLLERRTDLVPVLEARTCVVKGVLLNVLMRYSTHNLDNGLDHWEILSYCAIQSLLK
jgi:hypothetical protein